MKKIILLNGPPKSGKDLVATYLVETQDFMHFKFADPIRKVVKTLFDPESIDEFKSISLNEGYQGRDFMIDLAEGLLKKKLGKEFFSERLCTTLQDPFFHYTHRFKHIVISDLGFEEEAEHLFNSYGDFLDYVEVDHRFEIWHVLRPGCSFSGDSRSFVDSSYCDVKRIKNDDTLSNLYDQVRALANE